MSEIDDWTPIKQPQPVDDWEPVTLAERPVPGVGEALPEAFMDRVRWGQAIGRIAQAAGKGAEEGAGAGTLQRHSAGR
jgi:hypothetical protein